MDKLPVVYVRGYAGSTSGINRQVDDPFYGFNLGSTHVRVGREGNPIFYQFESPLLRLLIDESYKVIVQGSQEDYLDRQQVRTVPPESIWIHRFYDVSASTWGDKPHEFGLPKAAEDLLKLIEKLQAKTGAPQVHLVAHSMGETSSASPDPTCSGGNGCTSTSHPRRSTPMKYRRIGSLAACPMTTTSRWSVCSA